LKDVRVILAILLVITLLGATLGGYFYHSAKTKEIALKDSEIVQLQASITQIGVLLEAYTVTADVKMGQKILETDLTPIQVPTSMSNGLVLDKAELIGKHYKLDLTAGTAVSKDVVYAEPLTDDMRLVDLVLHSIPVGLKVGQFVDVRIALPLGEDFISIPHKKVAAINAGVLKLVINEEDIHTYNSMLIDSLLYPGTQMYAVEYLEGGVQKAADSFYPVSKNILAVAQKDPNLLTAIKSDILQRRTALEVGLDAMQTEQSKLARENIDIILTTGRSRLQESVVEASRDHEVKAAQQAEIDKANEAAIAAQQAADAAAAAAAEAAKNAPPVAPPATGG
jgi:hypothetical protein